MFTILMHHSAEIGLILFLIVFLLVLFFALTRTRKELDNWASLPLEVTIKGPQTQEDKQ
jgi:cbb3-type cytochrome oxidase subunit 3